MPRPSLMRAFCCAGLFPQTFLRSRGLPVPRWLDDQANDPADQQKLQDMLSKAMQTSK